MVSARRTFWHPLTAFDLWTPFVRCMMTVLDEHKHSKKYQHILLPEYYEFLGRVAFRYYEIRKEHGQIKEKKDKEHENFRKVADFL